MTLSVSESLTLTMTTSPPPLIHAVSGALGGAIALILLYPLERIRIEMQKQLQLPQTTDRNTEPLDDDDVETIVFTSSPIKRPLSSSPSSSNDIMIGESWSFEAVKQSDDHYDNTNENFQDAVSELQQQNTEPHSKSQQQQQQHQAIITCFRSLLQRNELYRGISPVVTTLAISNFIFFFMNEWFKNHLLQPPSITATTTTTTATRAITSRYRSLLASTLAGICNVLITNPLWVTNLRITTGDATYQHLITEMMHTIRQHNHTVQHLWSGTMASLLLVTNPVIQFFVYEELKSWQRRQRTTPPHPLSHRSPSITPGTAFVMGAIAKTIATMLTYPLQVAQSLLRMQETINKKGPPSQEHGSNVHSPPAQQAQAQRYTGTVDCLQQLYQQNGILSLYTGIRAKLLQTVLTAAFTFVSYEQIVQTLHTFLLIYYQSNRSTATTTMPSRKATT